jgi:hypothetical protein
VTQVAPATEFSGGKMEDESHSLMSVLCILSLPSQWTKMNQSTIWYREAMSPHVYHTLKHTWLD